MRRESSAKKQEIFNRMQAEIATREPAQQTSSGGSWQPPDRAFVIIGAIAELEPKLIIERVRARVAAPEDDHSTSIARHSFEIDTQE